MYKIEKAKADIIGYKKIHDSDNKSYIVTLLIPKGTLFGINTISTCFGIILTSTKRLRSSWCTNTQDGISYDLFKCRSELAYVLDISGGVGEVDHVNPYPLIDGDYAQTVTTYSLDEVVIPHAFSRNLHECESGIHWFPEKWMAQLW
jgi:hypothetical protein